MPNLGTTVLSIAGSIIVSYSIARWKVSKVRKQQRADKVEDWYRETAAISWMAKWELRRLDGDIDITDRAGLTAFAELEDDSQLSYADELMEELFRHAGKAPHEIHRDEESPFIDQIRDCISEYLQPDKELTTRTITLEGHRDNVTNELERIRKRALRELDETNPGSDGLLSSLRS